MKLLTATLDRFEEDDAVLVLDDGQQLRVNKDYIIGFSEGDTVTLNFFNDADAQGQREKILKGILNEVITQQGSQERDKGST